MELVRFLLLLLPLSNAALVIHTKIFTSKSGLEEESTDLVDYSSEPFLHTTPSPEGSGGLNDDETEMVLTEHNQGRRVVQPEAANMNLLAWDSDLEQTAQSFVDNCVYQSFQPPEFNNRPYMAEVTGQSDVGFRLPKNIAVWYSFGSYFNYDNNICFENDEMCDAYRVLVTARLTRFGCAQQYCRKLTDMEEGGAIKSHIVYWKCYYESEVPIYFTDHPYIAGPPCTACGSGEGWCSNHLCDSSCNHYIDGCTCEVVCEGDMVVDAGCCSCQSLDTYAEHCEAHGKPPCTGGAILHPFTCECLCQEGYVSSPGGCVDFNECTSGGHMCTDYCFNDNGTYSCGCSTGFQLTSDGYSCQDIDECSHDNGGCSQYCTNTPGSFYCSCDIEWSLTSNGYSCKPLGIPIFEGGVIGRLILLPETNVENCVTAELPCSHICTNTTYGYECDCEPGYELGFDNHTCIDIDECAVDNGNCEEDCYNLNGSHSCLCGNETILQYDDHRCQKDACAMGTHCYGNGYLDTDNCICRCSDGYKGTQCDIACNYDDDACWEEYRESPLRFGEDFCPIYCHECACLDNYPACQNGGKLKWSHDSEHCRCYCPQPWTGKSCQECSIHNCSNGGTLDTNTCRCKCPRGWTGPRCDVACKQKSMLCTDMTRLHCDGVPFVAAKCPVLCGICEA